VLVRASARRSTEPRCRCVRRVVEQEVGQDGTDKNVPPAHLPSETAGRRALNAGVHNSPQRARKRWPRSARRRRWGAPNEY
jgi:hypothetical protein